MCGTPRGFDERCSDGATGAFRSVPVDDVSNRPCLCPEGTSDNSPPIHRWDTLPIIPKPRRATEVAIHVVRSISAAAPIRKSCQERSFVPGGTWRDCRSAKPPLKRWAIVRRPWRDEIRISWMMAGNGARDRFKTSFNSLKISPELRRLAFVISRLSPRRPIREGTSNTIPAWSGFRG